MTALVLAFVRTAALLAMLPVWNATSAPRWVGPLCALGCAALVAPGLDEPDLPNVAAMLHATVAELLMGAVAGLTVRAVFASLTMAAELAAQQSGFGFATMFDPITAAQESPYGTLSALLGAAVFLGTGQHLELLGAIAESFVRWPLGTGPSLGLPIAVFVNEAFVLGVQMAGPLTVGGLLMQLFLGLLTKTAPRLQAFFAVGPTLTALAGLFLFAASLPWLLAVHEAAVAESVDRVRHWFTGG